MNEQELRALIRDSVARHLAPPGTGGGARPAAPASRSSASDAPWQGHASHNVYVSLVNVGDACLIEPSVACNHCDYCKSHGH